MYLCAWIDTKQMCCTVLCLDSSILFNLFITEVSSCSNTSDLRLFRQKTDAVVKEAHSQGR